MFLNGTIDGKFSLPEKLVLKASQEQNRRLKNRAKELFPNSEILIEASEQFELLSLPVSTKLNHWQNKFLHQIKNLPSAINEQAYLLNAEKDELGIIAQSAKGLYYGMLALFELVKNQSQAVELFDFPSFSQRGFLQDLSRGQALNPSGFERLIKALALFRYNWLTFNLEHNFGYESHPEIPEGDDQLSKSEAKALFELCQEYFIEPVPMQQSLGHLRGILTKPKYKNLAFDENLLWSLNPEKEQIYSLLNELYQEQAEVFPGNYFLVGLDEPFDMKKRASKSSDFEKSFPKIYLNHLLKLHKIVSKLGRKMMLWGDMILAHPELIPEIPEDIMIINWQYGTSQLENEEFYFKKTQPIAKHHQQFYIATTTWSYARLFPELKTMEANNRNFLKVGEKLSAQGALLTNWGDLGHIQLLGYIAPAIGFFGLNSWKNRGISLEEFCQKFSKFFCNDETGQIGQFYLLLNQINEILSPGKLLGGSALFLLLDELYSHQYLPKQDLENLSEELLKLIKSCSEITTGLSAIKNSDWVLDLKPIIFALGILFIKLLLKKKTPLILKQANSKDELSQMFQYLEFYSKQFAQSFKERWLTQAHPKGLEKILSRLAKTQQGYKKRLEQIQKNKIENWQEFQNSPEFQEYRFNLLQQLGLNGLL